MRDRLIGNAEHPKNYADNNIAGLAIHDRAPCAAASAVGQCSRNGNEQKGSGHQGCLEFRAVHGFPPCVIAVDVGYNLLSR